METTEPVPDLTTRGLRKPYSEYELFLLLTLRLVVTIPGIIGNALCLAVFRRQKRSSSAYFLLQALAVCDILYVSVSFLLDTPDRVMAQVQGVPLHGVYKSIETYVTLLYPMVNVVEMWNVYVVVTVSIDRYIHICMPLKAKSMDTRRYAKMAVIGTFFFALMSVMPKIGRRYAGWVWNEKNEGYEAWPMTRQYGQTKTYFVGFYVYVMLVIHLIPLLGILIPVNVAVMRGWRRMRQEQDAMKSTREKEGGMDGTKLTIAMVNIFILLRLPAGITMLLVQLEGMGLITNYEIDDFSRWTNFLSKLNSTVNFFIYVSVGKSFRDTFIDMCRRCFGCAPLRRI